MRKLLYKINLQGGKSIKKSEKSLMKKDEYELVDAEIISNGRNRNIGKWHTLPRRETVNGPLLPKTVGQAGVGVSIIIFVVAIPWLVSMLHLPSAITYVSFLIGLAVAYLCAILSGIELGKL